MLAQRPVLPTLGPTADSPRPAQFKPGPSLLQGEIIGHWQLGHYTNGMDLDDLLNRYFATNDISQLSPDALAAGIERCQVDLGLEQDRGKRFAL